ncbi:MAG: hypothetical protein H0U21_00815, partial [Acidimicrobiia bacterium]|nr:hypothetical protein [Acidimicrobiia bacterium]
PRIYRQHGPAFATLTGNYDTTATFVSETCPTGNCVGYADAGTQVPGAARTGSGSLEFDCSGGFPCQGTSDGTSPAAFDGLAITLAPAAPDTAACIHDDDADGIDDRESGQITVALAMSLVPTRADVRDVRWQVTRLEGRFVRTDVVVDGGGCAAMAAGQTTVYTYDVVWTLA